MTLRVLRGGEVRSLTELYESTADDMAPVLRIGAPMKVLAFRPRTSPSASRDRLNFPLLAPGAYAGRARFRPKHADRLPEALRAAVGRVVEVAFAGMESTTGPFAGQALFLEWRSDDVFAGFFIPEQDLEFLKDMPDPRA